MDASTPVMCYNGQPLSVEDLKIIIQQRDAQEVMIRQMQQNNNELVKSYNTLWNQNEYHKKELERIQRENAMNQNALIRDNLVLWQEREQFRNNAEELQAHLQNLVAVNGEVELEQVELAHDIDVSVYLYDPTRPQDIPQVVKIVGWGKKFYEVATGDYAENFYKLDEVTRQLWLEDYKKVKSVQQSQTRRGLIKPVAELPKTYWKREMVAMDDGVEAGEDNV